MTSILQEFKERYGLTAYSDEIVLAAIWETFSDREKKELLEDYWNRLLDMVRRCLENAEKTDA